VVLWKANLMDLRDLDMGKINETRRFVREHSSILSNLVA
jgi:hypothetical protein